MCFLRAIDKHFAYEWFGHLIDLYYNQNILRQKLFYTCLTYCYLKRSKYCCVIISLLNILFASSRFTSPIFANSNLFLLITFFNAFDILNTSLGKQKKPFISSVNKSGKSETLVHIIGFPKRIPSQTKLGKPS